MVSLDNWNNYLEKLSTGNNGDKDLSRVIRKSFFFYLSSFFERLKRIIRIERKYISTYIFIVNFPNQR